MNDGRKGQKKSNQNYGDQKKGNNRSKTPYNLDEMYPQKENYFQYNNDFQNRTPSFDYQNVHYDGDEYAKYNMENINNRMYSQEWNHHGMAHDPEQYRYYHRGVFNPHSAGMSAPFINENMLDSEEQNKFRQNGKKKIKLEYIPGRNKRNVTFSKRKKGIMKKAYELNILTGTEILLLVASESGHVYTFATPKLRPIISNHEHIIQSCLSEPVSIEDNQSNDQKSYDEEDDQFDSTSG